MGKIIFADQVLHGYKNGHQLLEASCELNRNDKTKMDELSDLNGRTDEISFVNYYTGYPISDGEKYVIAKTWYASEMKRPGCVWTHSMVFDTKDIRILTDINTFLDSFQRPRKGQDQEYSKRIVFQLEDRKQNLDDQRKILEYMLYTLFSTGRPKYIAVQAEEMVKEFFMVLNVMPYELLKSFTFCTMSYADRKYQENSFQYQMIPAQKKNMFLGENENIFLCPEIEQIEKYPYWVSAYTDALVSGTLGNLDIFVGQYVEKELSLEIYNCLIRIFFVMDSKHMSLEEYFDAIEFVLPELKEGFWQKTVDLVLEGTFYKDYFKRQEYEIIDMFGMAKFHLSVGKRRMLAVKVIQNSPEKVYLYLKEYINGKCSVNTRSMINLIIKNLRPKDLQEASKMEEAICVVLVHKNGNLMLSKDIWKQSKEFQRNLLYSCNRQVSDHVIKELVPISILYGYENICDDLYNVFDDRIIGPLYDIVDENILLSDEQFSKWMKFLSRSKRLFISNWKKVRSWNQRLTLFLHLDIHTDNILDAFEPHAWEEIYNDLFVNVSNQELKVKMVLKFFEVLFSGNQRFSDRMVHGIVTVIYQELAHNSLSLDHWRQIEYLLPEVEDWYVWDKCLRVRKAVESKGYKISFGQ